MTSRSLNKRQALITATRRVAGQRGLASTTVRDIALEAAVSAGSVLYHYPTLDQLLAEAVDDVLDEFHRSRIAAVELVADPCEKLRVMIVHGVPDRITDSLRIVYESSAYVRAHPELLPMFRTIMQRQLSLYRQVLEIGVGLGAFRPRAPLAAVAQNILALEDAYDYYAVAGDRIPVAVARANIIGYAELVLDCDLAEKTTKRE
ncbi:TetR family transcriptional regulator [Saxibacter everestensis]|uniref:TetR family transcriptional regulator n=1 Tax=Saxibacter everestensis TaxID=2909229 RepID=A0ABY8QW83_9MICO|nr:TetR family transcriptional regulator [Brevibacteriaceae bacterium ZFBP1038]